MTRILPLVALLLPACYVGPVFKLVPQAKRTCATSDFLDYEGGLPYMVSQGKGDGLFAFDPIGPLAVGTEGFYDLKTAEFAWATDYAKDAHR